MSTKPSFPAQVNTAGPQRVLSTAQRLVAQSAEFKREQRASPQVATPPLLQPLQQPFQPPTPPERDAAQRQVVPDHSATEQSKLIANKHRGDWTNGQKQAQNPVFELNLAATGAGVDASAIRLAMVTRLMAAGLDNALVLQALARVPRHRFVDAALATQAYEDTSLPIGLGQTISKPSVVGHMMALLLSGACATPAGVGGRVLEIGTGCGYQAALLSLIADSVYSIERLAALHARAKANLAPLAYTNIVLELGDGRLGSTRGAPYAGIIAAAGGEDVPRPWVEQLASGGRIVAPVQNEHGVQRLVVIDKTAGGVRTQSLDIVQFVPLKSGLA